MTSSCPAQPFMLLASARTGSNYVASLLGAHPSIRMCGEIFNLDTLPQRSLVEALDDPVTYFRARVYDGRSRVAERVGFKMFYDHMTMDYFDKPVSLGGAAERLRSRIAACDQFVAANYDKEVLEARFRAVWDFISADRSLPIIHLNRRNLLQTFVSLKMAFATDQWWSLQLMRTARPKLHLDADEVRRYFERMEASVERAQQICEGHPCLELIYEEVAAAEEQELERIFRFLGVAPRRVATTMRKQITEPVDELVTNYDALKEAFALSRWHRLFV
jgi:LPS sulfotransferase NodH